MHEAYKVHPLITLNHQVESIAAHENTLLVGTRQGYLFMYSLEEPNCELTLMRYNKSFSKKPIQQLEVIPGHDLLLSLTDHVVQLHDITTFNTLEVLEKTRGATFFALHSEKLISSTGEVSFVIRLAVALKRKIQLYFLKNKKFHPLAKSDVSVPDIKSMVWCQNVICLGCRDEYTLLDVTDNELKKLFPTSSAKASDPCILNISNSHFALCRDKQTILVNTSGETDQNKAVKWPEPPINLVYDAPYTLGVLTNCIEVCCLDPNMLIQTLTDMPKVRFLVQAKQGLLFAASLFQIWCLRAVDTAYQQEVLLSAKEFQLAVKLIEASDESEEDKKAKVNQILTVFACDLFAKKQFAESMREFLKLRTDPYDVIRLYPDMLPQAQQEESLFSGKDLTDKEAQESIVALTDFLTAMRPFVTDLKTTSSNTDGTVIKTNKSTHQLLQIMDTTLIKCYLQTKDAMVAPILRLNCCHAGETEKILKKMGKFNDLIILYETIGRHRKALELLQTEQSLEEGSVERTIRYLQKLGSQNMGLILEFSGWVLTKEPEKGLKIFTEDLLEVENLPRPRVLDTLLKDHPDLAIPYLEHVVYNWKDENPLFHNALIHQYREKILKDGLAHSEHTRTKLLNFLEKSNQYTAENILKNFPTDCLLEERALIWGRLGKHDQVIALYVRALGDVKKAENYCASTYEKGGPGSQNVYVSLISLILKPDSSALALPGVTLSPKTAQPDQEQALRLLEENASKINPVEMLAALPDDIVVSRIHKFLSVALQKVLQERRQVQLLKGLLYAEHLQCQEMKLALQRQRVLITELNVCPVCKKRFSNQAALIRYPNGDVVHYACHKEK